MTRPEWISILAQARVEIVDRLVDRVEAHTSVELTRPPAPGLLLATVRETVEGDRFHPGEILVTTCEARIDEHLGYAVILGGDGRKARGCAILDAALQADLRGRDDVISALEEERRWRRAQDHAEREMVQSTRVHFDTMEPQR